MKAQIWIKAWGYANPSNANHSEVIGEWQGERASTIQQAMDVCETWLDKHHPNDWEECGLSCGDSIPRYQNKGWKYIGAICPVVFEYDDPIRQFEFSENEFLSDHHEDLTVIWQHVISGNMQVAQEVAFKLEDDLKEAQTAAIRRIEERYQEWQHRPLGSLHMDKR